MRTADLSKEQLRDITTIERVASIFSLLGCVWIAVTFCASKAFRKPINRLVLYASLGNIFTNVATIMSRDYLYDPTGPGCQIQAFFIQMFMPADAVWTLAMAANVWLTFYHKYDSDQLRALEKWYLLLCYGLPFLPALVFCVITSQSKGRVYGNATLWCWIGSEWEVLRLACFYAPVWLVILATISIYLRAGKDIYKRRKQLRAFHIAPPIPMPIVSDPFTNTKTTEVMVTSEAVTSVDTIDLQQLAPREINPRRPGEPSKAKPPAQSYQVTVTSQAPRPSHDDGRWSYQEKYNSSPQQSPADRRASTGEGLMHTTHNIANAPPARRYAAMEANNAAWSYTKVAVLFFLAMMITWIPSSANRVYSVVHPGHISLALQFSSAFVLPLQGFWNALIYTTTSLPACKALWRQMREGKRSSGVSSNGASAFRGIKGHFSEDSEAHGWGGRRTGGRGDKYSLEETESMTELHTSSRPATKDSSSR